MKEVLADASYFVALLNPTDGFHSAAQSCARKLRSRLVVAEPVLLELGSAFSRRADRRLFVRLAKAIRSDPHTEFVPANSELLQKGLTLFSRRLDKDWSLVDCISFIVMKARSISTALTADHHFEQAGFKILLK